ncbi:MAG: CHASE domain-containing protein [Pseudomonadota bacterium]
MIGSTAWKGPGKWLLSVAAIAVVYYAAARLGLLLAFASTNASPVWPPSGIALSALLLFGYRIWPSIFIGAFAANFAVFAANNVGNSLTTTQVSLVIAGGNTLEALTGVFLLHHLVGKRGYFTQSINIYKFVFTAALVSAISSSIGTISLIIGNIAPAAAQWPIASTWWLGDVAGMLVVTPLLVAWSTPLSLQRSARSLLAIVASFLVLALVLTLIFKQQFSADISNRWLAYLLLPCIGWAAYRYGRRGVTLVLATVAGSAVLATTRGLGPFAAGTLQDSLAALEIFIALCSVVGLVLAADMCERKRIQSDASLGNRLLPLLHWATLFICLGLTIIAWHFISSSTERRAQDRFNYIAQSVQQRIDERMNVYENLLHAGQGLFKASASVERDEWQKFVKSLKIERDFPGVQSIGYAKKIVLAEKSAIEQSAHADGMPTFRIWPEGERSEYIPVFYIEPSTDRNRRAFGFDMFSEPVRRAAMMQARDSSEAAISGKVMLVQETGKDAQTGFLMYLPVYRNCMRIETKEERIAALEGYVYSPYRMTNLMSNILEQSFPEVALQVFDGDKETADALMYSSHPKTIHTEDYPNAFTVRKIISIVNNEQIWTLRITSLPVFEAAIDRQKSLIVLVAGTMISLLFFGIVSSLTAMREKAQALANEMTGALKETNRTLRQSEERFRLLTSSVKDYSILLLDPNGFVLTWNEGAQRMKGYTEEEIVGRSFECFYLSEDSAAGKPQQTLDDAKITGKHEDIGWRQRKDGTRFYADVLLTAIRDDQNELIGFAKITRDITQEKHVEQELRSAMEEAKSASRAKSEFVANMSHELRTPMNAVLGMTYLLGNSTLSNDQTKYLDMIRSSGQSLLNILNDILDFSKIEAGRMELSLAPFHLSDVLNAIATIMSVNAGEKDLELAIGVVPDVPQTLIGDAMRLQQILINLVGNAVKFTERGEVSVLVEALERKGDLVTIIFRVRDTGIGMTSEQQARLFSPFTQADSSMTRRFGGSGLGLTICRRLIDLMDGTIEMRSQLDKGSEFCATISLQVAIDQDDLKRQENAMNDLRMLIVDDHQTSRTYIGKTIEAWNWRVDSAASGLEAIGCIRTAKVEDRHYDAILSDWQMPGMDGISTMQAIRKLLPDSPIPVILMVSAFGRGKLMNIEAASQANAILMKPVTGSSLFDTLHEVLVGRSENQQTIAVDANRFIAAHHLDGINILLAEDNALNQIVAKGMLEQAGATIDVVEDGKTAVALLRSVTISF